MLQRTAVIISILVVCGSGLRPSSVSAGGTACCLQTLWVIHPTSTQGDRFLNYDFTAELSAPDPTRVDWPIGLFFTNGATVNRVKNAYWGSTSIGSSMHAYMEDGNGVWDWDDDRGTKTGGCLAKQVFRHMRVYAIGDQDRMYNWNWGYWVLASAHYDREECTQQKTFGWTDSAEDYMLQHAASIGWSTLRAWSDCGSAERRGWRGNNYWLSDGLCHDVHIYP
jgi:hypothetical protein